MTEERTRDELRTLQALPLDLKIRKSKARIAEWYKFWEGDCCVSFSGGKDSTVLLHLVRSMYPEIPAVFTNTGLEYPEIQMFVQQQENVDIVYPKINFAQVITECGYPLISKEVAECIYYARRQPKLDVDGGGTRPDEARPDLSNKPRGWNSWESGTMLPESPQAGRNQSADGKTFSGSGLGWNRPNEECQAENPLGNTRNGQLNYRKHRRMLLGLYQCMDQTGGVRKSNFNKEKWLPIARDLPVKISHKCCDVMKKSPLQIYQRKNKLKPFLGTMAEESRLREQAWLRHGCNAFDATKKTSQPMAFWTEQDVLEYINRYHLDYASPYGDLIQDEAGLWHFTGCQRTGCVYCAFGQHLEKGEGRFERLKKTHPRQYDYCIGGGQWIDNPDYDPDYDGQPDEMGWIEWNPSKLWVPSKEGLGFGKVFDMANEVMVKAGYKEMWRY